MMHILITGASSGIGEALAIHYASPSITLSLCGRDKSRLSAVATQCINKGAIVHQRIIDVTDKAAMHEWILKTDDNLPLDLVVANAGVGLSQTGYDAAETTFAINMGGVINTIHPILPRMENRQSGQIALISSIAGYVGLPSAPAYSASKNFVRAYGEALRGKFSKSGIKINVICPGFVKSRLTDQNTFKMPFLMNGQKAAYIIAKGLQANKGRITFPWPMMVAIKFISILPYPIYEWLSKKLPNKG